MAIVFTGSVGNSARIANGEDEIVRDEPDVKVDDEIGTLRVITVVMDVVVEVVTVEDVDVTDDRMVISEGFVVAVVVDGFEDMEQNILLIYASTLCNGHSNKS